MSTRTASLVVGLICIAASGTAAQQARVPDAAPNHMESAKALYASASYEAALARLDIVSPAESLADVELYRALCFLALGRKTDAERSLELLVRRSPDYRVSDAEVSPRLVELFSEVRMRVLPQTAKEAYARARWSFEGGDFTSAAHDFRQLLSLLADLDPVSTPRDVLDLRLVADGFLELAEAELARRTRPGAPRASAADAPARIESSGRIYSDENRDVKAPIELARTLPQWSPPPGFRDPEFRGVLELVIDASGAVESAVTRGAAMPGYDDTLRAAAKSWKYRPAMLRDGTPVRYRLLVGYLLKPVRS